MTDEETLYSIRETRKLDQLLFPAANLTEGVLRPVFLPLVGSETAFERLFKRAEYRFAIAIASAISLRQVRRSSLAAGTFIGEGEWRDPYEGRNGEGDLKWAREFFFRGDTNACGLSLANGEEFSKTHSRITAGPRLQRRD